MKRSRRALLEELRKKRERRRRRFWLAVLVLLILMLLLLLRSCSCAPPPEQTEPDATVSDAVEPVEPEPEPEPLTGRMDPLDRPAFATRPPQELPWLSSFRLQVAARSPRLAECFVGAARPGALKWTASVEPGSGQVSDHELEPTLDSDPLTSKQRACVLEVLSDPPYRLEGGDERSTPSRVGMAIEF